MIIEGLKLMVLGMGYVMLFLSLVLCCMWIMGGWFEKIRIRNVQLNPPVSAFAQAALDKQNNQELVAVISSAIMSWRQSRQNEKL